MNPEETQTTQITQTTPPKPPRVDEYALHVIARDKAKKRLQHAPTHYYLTSEDAARIREQVRSGTYTFMDSAKAKLAMRKRRSRAKQAVKATPANLKTLGVEPIDYLVVDPSAQTHTIIVTEAQRKLIVEALCRARNRDKTKLAEHTEIVEAKQSDRTVIIDKLTAIKEAQNSA